MRQLSGFSRSAVAVAGQLHGGVEGLRRGVGGGSSGGGLGEVDVGAVGHFEHVGHVGAGADVKDGVAVAEGFEDVEHAGAKAAGVHAPGFAGFEVEVELILLAHAAQEADEGVAVVVGLGDPVAAAEVQVADLR